MIIYGVIERHRETYIHYVALSENRLFPYICSIVQIAALASGSKGPGEE